MDSQARSIIEQLQEVIASLRGYAYNVWTTTDVSDNSAMTRSLQFVSQFNEQLKLLDQTAVEITAAIQQYSGVEPDTNADTDPDGDASGDVPASAAISDASPTPTRRLKVFPLDGAFTDKNPYGFRLLDQSFLGMPNWSDLYRQVLKQFAQHNPITFHDLPNNKSFIGGRRRYTNEYRESFNRTGERLNRGYQVTPDVYADIGYQANAICGQISKLLDVFDVPEGEFELYLRRRGRDSAPIEEE